MRYIVPCSSCGTELRIPLDLGKLTVRCPRCYHSFVFDPEDTTSLRGGRYDTPSRREDTGNPRSLRGFFRFLNESFLNFRSKFKKNEAYGWESPTQGSSSSKHSGSYSVRKEFAPLLAKYLLFALLLVGILRACFFSQNRIPSIQENQSPPPYHQQPNTPPADSEEDPPQVEI